MLSSLLVRFYRIIPGLLFIEMVETELVYAGSRAYGLS